MQLEHKNGLGILRERAEFALVWILVCGVGVLPRRVARQVGALIGAIAFRTLGRLRNVGLHNLGIGYPEWAMQRRISTLKLVYRNLGYHLAEFCLMRTYRADEAGRSIEYDGLEHYLAARERGQGVLVLTGHLGAWELSSFFHSLVGYPMDL